MSGTYVGDNSTGLIVATTLPDDGDVRDVASVNVSLQSILDSIASLASGTVEFTGIHNYTSGATLGIQDSNIVLSGTSFIQLGSGCGFAAGNGSTVAAVNSTWTFDAATSLSFAGNMTLTGTSTLDLLSGHRTDVHSGADVHVNEGGGLHIDAPSAATGGLLQINGTANVNSTGELHVKSAGLLTVESGGFARIEAGGDLNVYGTATIRSSGVLALATSSAMTLTAASISLDSSSVLGFDGSTVSGRALRTGADVQVGISAWRGIRIGRIAPSSQTVHAERYDAISFNAAVASSFTLTIDDIASGDQHPVRFWIYNASNTGIGANVVTLQDSMAAPITVFTGNTWTIAFVDLVYEPTSTPRWSFTGGSYA